MPKKTPKKQQQNPHHEMASNDASTAKLAAKSTFHCLMGCGLGEVVGIVIGVVLGLSRIATIVIAVTLGFVFGFILGIRPLLAAKMEFRHAAKTIITTEGLSIAVMETAEVLAQLYIPGVMDGHLMSPLFWIGLILSLGAGYIAAYPVNYYLVKKGLSHCCH
jgi:hypothetical protein